MKLMIKNFILVISSLADGVHIRPGFLQSLDLPAGRFIYSIVILHSMLILAGCGTGNSRYPLIYRACWSPDQSYIVQSSDIKSRSFLFMGESRNLYYHQELHLRWCSVDEVDKPKDIRLNSVWFSDRMIDAPPIYFSQDGTKVALRINDKITVVELSSGEKSALKPDQWHAEEWISACEYTRDINNTQCSLQGDKLPEGFAAGIVSPDGKYTALIDYVGHVVIENKNLKNP